MSNPLVAWWCLLDLDWGREHGNKRADRPLQVDSPSIRITKVLQSLHGRADSGYVVWGAWVPSPPQPCLQWKMPLEVWWSSDLKLLKPNSSQVLQWLQLSCPAPCLSPEAFKPLTFWYSVPNFCLIFHWFVLSIHRVRVLKSPNIFLDFFTLLGVSIFVLYILKLLFCVCVYVCTRICMCVYIWDAYLFLSVCLCVISKNFPYSKVHFACLLVATTSFFLLPIPPFFPLPLTVSCYTVPMYMYTHACAHRYSTLKLSALEWSAGIADPSFSFNANSSDPVLMSSCMAHLSWPLTLCNYMCSEIWESCRQHMVVSCFKKKNHSQYCCLFVMC